MSEHRVYVSLSLTDESRAARRIDMMLNTMKGGLHLEKCICEQYNVLGGKQVGIPKNAIWLVE